MDDEETETIENPDAEEENALDEENQGDTEESEDKKDPELQKAIQARDRAKRKMRELQQELDKLKNKDTEEADPVAEANTKIVRTAAHGILRGLGVESKEDRIEVLNLLRLDDIDVDADGADEDAIEERIEKLREVLGAKPSSPGRNVPRSVKPNRGTKETNSDPDKARYARILGTRG
jgi:hypothetical protein